MRKLIYAALMVVALGVLLGSAMAYAGDCCQPKCKQSTCTKAKCDTGCKQECCKPKCESCKPKCESCKPKCESCKPKCKQNTCTKCNKCDTCKPKCDTCKPKCDGCCKPKCEKSCNPCKSKCNKCNKCNNCCEDPYAAMWKQAGMICDLGCCAAGFHIPKCEVCETVCKTVETTDPCTGCTKVSYVSETVCHEIERPHVIPWWFNEKGAGNIYIDDKAEEAPAEEAPADAAK
jgi:hypothetical protein